MAAGAMPQRLRLNDGLVAPLAAVSRMLSSRQRPRAWPAWGVLEVSCWTERLEPHPCFRRPPHTLSARLCCTAPPSTARCDCNSHARDQLSAALRTFAIARLVVVLSGEFA